MELVEKVSKEKLRGGFYTPIPIVDFILAWAMNGNEKYDLLEPSCGDGVFLRRLKDHAFKYNSITAVELDHGEAKKANSIDIPNKTVLNLDFHEYCLSTEDRFDLVVGNPPYIRYQYFDKKQQTEAEKVFDKANLKYSKLTNSWVSFVVGSSLLLKDTGKIGFVLPAEILQVSYAAQLRDFLARFYNKINIVSFRKLVFPGIQQEVVLLLCEKNNSNSHLIEHLEVENIQGLRNLDVIKLKSPKKDIDFRSNKWTFYFLDQEEINFMEELLDQGIILPLRHYATVQVGMTTGANSFFTVPKSVVEEYDLHEYTKPMVGRSVQVSGAIFDETDWKLNSEAGARSYFLLFPAREQLKNNERALEYIKRGEDDEIHKGYKCRIRDEWQIVPSAWIPEALFVRRNNIHPKLVINQAGAYTTDTMHRVSIKKGDDLIDNRNVNIEAFTASYYNSLSFAFAEVCGRSHGGGVLELMPNEVEDILLPYNEENATILSRLDEMLKEKKDIDTILKFSDEIVLKEGYGFSKSDVRLANGIWKKLLNRRKNRG